MEKQSEQQHNRMEVQEGFVKRQIVSRSWKSGGKIANRGSDLTGGRRATRGREKKSKDRGEGEKESAFRRLRLGTIKGVWSAGNGRESAWWKRKKIRMKKVECILR